MGTLVIGDLKLDILSLSLNLTSLSFLVVIVKSLKLFKILGLLRVVDSQNFEEEITRVAELGDLKHVKRFEVVHTGGTSIALVNSVTISHQDKSVEVEESFGRRSVNG